MDSSLVCAASLLYQASSKCRCSSSQHTEFYLNVIGIKLLYLIPIKIFVPFIFVPFFELLMFAHILISASLISTHPYLTVNFVLTLIFANLFCSKFQPLIFTQTKCARLIGLGAQHYTHDWDFFRPKLILSDERLAICKEED